jgi:hypothetical protein
MNSLTRREKEHIKRDISKLEKDELIEVYKIISNSTDKISKNKNGVFINLKYIPDETLLQIRSFIQFRKDHINQLNTPIVNMIEKATITVEKPESVIVNKPNILINKIESKTSNNDIGNKFCFQNFVEKLSINTHKLFPSEYGTKQVNTTHLRAPKVKFSNSLSRILKKCRDIHTLAPNDEYSDNVSNDGEGAVTENLEKIRNAHKMHSIADNSSDSSESSSESDESEENNIEDPKWDLDDTDDEKSFTSDSS